MVELLESENMKTITLLESLGLGDEAEKIILESDAQKRKEETYFKEEEIQWRQEKNKARKEFVEEFRKDKLNQHWESRINKKIPDKAQILKAKEMPIENIVKVNSAGFALCADHEDSKPSMYCKNNYAYCFTCGYKADVIALYQKVNHVSFWQAINQMQ